MTWLARGLRACNPGYGTTSTHEAKNSAPASLMRAAYPGRAQLQACLCGGPAMASSLVSTEERQANEKATSQ